MNGRADGLEDREARPYALVSGTTTHWSRAASRAYHHESRSSPHSATSLVPDTETRSTLEALFDAVKAGRVEEVHAQLDPHPAWIDAFDPSEGCCRGTLLNVAVDRGA